MKKEQIMTAIVAISEEEIARWEKQCKEMDEIYMNLQEDAIKCDKLWELNQFLFHNWDLGIHEINKRFRRQYYVYASYDDYIDDCLEQEYEEFKKQN